MELTVEVTIAVSIENAWKTWIDPAEVLHWNAPDPAWHTTVAKIVFQEGGLFLLRMELKDGSFGFDYAGKYDRIIHHQLIESTGDDGRPTRVTFSAVGDQTRITETYEPEDRTPIDIQRDFCQGVLNSFKEYAERKYS